MIKDVWGYFYKRSTILSLFPDVGLLQMGVAGNLRESTTARIFQRDMTSQTDTVSSNTLAGPLWTLDDTQIPCAIP